MKTQTLAPRVLAFLIALSLSIPPPALALRELSTAEKNPGNLSGLGQALKSGMEEGQVLGEAVELKTRPVVDRQGRIADLPRARTVLVTADAGKGTRFAQTGGVSLKVIAPVGGIPAGVRTKLAAEELGWLVVSVVGYQKDDVMAAYDQHAKPGIIYVEAEDPTGGTGYAIYHAAAVPGLRDSDVLVVATMGDQPLFDRAVLETVEQKARTSGADLVIASALFADPKGKGRIIRDRQDPLKVLGILEEKDIQQGAVLGGYSKEELLAIQEGNVSIYVMPARRLFDLLSRVRNANAQKQFYLTDIVKMVLDQGGRVEAVQIDPAKAPDITTADDLASVEAYLARQASAEEQVEKLTWRAWWKTLGYWGKTKKALGGFNEADQPALRSELNKAINEWTIEEVNFYIILRGGFPALLESSSTFNEFQVSLPVFQALVAMLLKEPQLEWNKISEEELYRLTREAIGFHREGTPYSVKVSPEQGYWEEISHEDRSNTGWPGDRTENIYHLVSPQTVQLVTQRTEQAGAEERAEKITIIPATTDRTGLEELTLAKNPPSAVQTKMPLRFLVDTGKGESGVLRLLEMAVQLRLKDGVPVQAVGVATEEELAEAEAAMPDDVSRELLRARVFTYTPGDEESHQVALALAETSVPGLAGIHPELIITEMNRSTVTWFLQALQRLGVNRFTQEMFDRVESYLTAA